MPSEQKLYCVEPINTAYEISYGDTHIGTIYKGGTFFECVYGNNEPVPADCLATATAFIINEHITDTNRNK